jgi:hypothetical protein
VEDFDSDHFVAEGAHCEQKQNDEAQYCHKNNQNFTFTVGVHYNQLIAIGDHIETSLEILLNDESVVEY